MFGRLAATATLLFAAHARADVAPYPERPDWPDTPLPMPPEALALVLLAVAVAFVWMARRGRT